MYRLLAGLFARELTADKFVGFQRGHGGQLLGALESIEEYAPLARFLITQFTKMADPEQTVLDLAESYAWNFHGVGGPYHARS